MQPITKANQALLINSVGIGIVQTQETDKQDR